MTGPDSNSRPPLFQRMSLHDHLIQPKSDSVQTPPLQWSCGVTPMSDLARSKSAGEEDRKEEDRETMVKLKQEAKPVEEKENKGAASHS